MDRKRWLVGLCLSTRTRWMPWKQSSGGFSCIWGGGTKMCFTFGKGSKKGYLKLCIQNCLKWAKKSVIFLSHKSSEGFFDIFVEGMYPRPRALWSKHRCALDRLSYAHSYQVSSVSKLLWGLYFTWDITTCDWQSILIKQVVTSIANSLAKLLIICIIYIRFKCQMPYEPFWK